MKSFFSVFTLLFIGSTVAIELDPLHHRNPRCLLKYSKGIGHLPQVRIYYDQSVNKCVEFVYFGWGGNDNRFETKKECIDACKIRTLTPTKKPFTKPLTVHTKPGTRPTKPTAPTTSIPGPHDAVCHLPLPPARNWPPNTKTGYAFDATANQCFWVYYDEETLNANNFPTREACLAYCSAAPPPTEQTQPDDAICSLPPPPTKEWPKDSKIAFWYDKKNDQCEPIYYDEATKNGNNFNTVEECLKTCSHHPNPTTPEYGNDESTTEKYFNEETSTPEYQHEPTTEGPLDKNDGTSTTEFYLEPTTESHQDDPVFPSLATSKPDKTERDRICNLPAPPNRDWTDHEHTGYHYDSETEECDLVYYDEETKNENLFQSLDECLDFCLPEETTKEAPKEETTEPVLDTTPFAETTPAPTEPPTTQKPTTPKPAKLSRYEVLKLRECALQPFSGYCKMAIPSYYFNITTMRCERYIYGGCSATANHYMSEKACEKSCVYRKIHRIPILPPPVKKPSHDECTISKLDGRCFDKNYEGYAYNNEHHACEHKVLKRCLRPLGLHKTLHECTKACVRRHPFIAPRHE